MAEAGDLDKLCCEFFQMCVEKEQAKKLTPAQKKEGKSTTVRKILKDGLGESSTMISNCEASILSKHQDRKTKKISDEDFVKKVLPDLAVMKSKCKSIDDDKAKAELTKMKEKLVKKLEEMKSDTGTVKTDAVVGRLTDTSKYTASHKSRFDADGTGKGKAGREDVVDNTGYVGNYKGEGSYAKK